MTCYELSELCQNSLDAIVMIKVGARLIPVTGLRPAENQRNAVEIEVAEPLATVAERDNLKQTVEFAIKG